MLPVGAIPSRAQRRRACRNAGPFAPSMRGLGSPQRAQGVLLTSCCAFHGARRALLLLCRLSYRRQMYARERVGGEIVGAMPAVVSSGEEGTDCLMARDGVTDHVTNASVLPVAL